MQYKLVVLDMDGTLLDNKHKVSEENKRAILSLTENGVGVVLASGRPFESIFPYTEDLGIDLPIVATNGALIKDPKTKEAIYSKELPFEYAKDIIQYGKENGYQISLYSDQGVLTFNEEMVDLHRSLENLNAQLIDEFTGEQALYKLIYADTPERIEAAYRTLDEKYKGKLYITRSDDAFLDVMNMNASKGKALHKLMEKLDFTKEEVLVMGNSYNDIAMFEVAGYSIAMDNSPQKVKNTANYVTKTNQQHGVAHALTKISKA